jgi:hypothetical protein
MYLGILDTDMPGDSRAAYLWLDSTRIDMRHVLGSGSTQ